MPKLRPLGLTLDSPASAKLSPHAPAVPSSTGGSLRLARKGSFTKGKAREAAGVVLSETHATPSCVVYGDEAHSAPPAGAALPTGASPSRSLGSGKGPVYVGSAHAFWNTDWLVDHGIGFVLNCAGSLERNFGVRHTSAVQRAREAGMTVMTVPWKDTVFTELQPLLSHALQFVAAARSTGQGILVHCAAGRSRSVTVCLAYAMLLDGSSFSSAFARLKQRHGDADPNPGFQDQLRELSGEAAVSTTGGSPGAPGGDEWGDIEVVEEGKALDFAPLSPSAEAVPGAGGQPADWVALGEVLSRIENKLLEAEAYPLPCTVLAPAPQTARGRGGSLQFEFGSSPIAAAASEGL